jgi:hypothetical protein
MMHALRACGFTEGVPSVSTEFTVQGTKLLAPQSEV